jgi:hypothetical protein
VGADSAFTSCDLRILVEEAATGGAFRRPAQGRRRHRAGNPVGRDGLGALVVGVEGASLLATGLGMVSASSGGAAAVLDGRDCVNDPGINGYCLGLTLGAIGVIMAAPELAVSAGLIAEPEYQDFLALATGGLFAGFGAVLADDLQALHDNLTSQKGLCEQA